MRKIYLTAILSSLCSMIFSQGYFVPTTYRGAFAPAPETPWTDTWTNWDPQNKVYPTSTVTVAAPITVNTTWTASNTYLIQGQIYVKNGATLTIEPGTVILGDKGTAGSALFVTQGSKLNAIGTKDLPIVFTSNQAAGSRGLGDWGGVVLLGRAATNHPSGIANIEGIAATPDTQFGGGTSPDDNDNSGTMQYCRIEFGGYVYVTNSEINGLTLGAVGRGTTIDHIQVSFANDDAYEWFGGTVNCRYLVSYRNLDDDFDTDNGYSGKNQFLLSVRDPAIADNPSVSTSEGFESDNNASGTTVTPQTSAIFSNVTLIGPFRGVPGSTVASGYRRGARIRRNSALKIYNSIFMDHLTGVYVDGLLCEANATSGSLKFNNNITAGNNTGKTTERNSTSTYNMSAWYGAGSNDSILSSAGILTTPYDFLAPDYRPVSSSIALSNFSFLDAGITSNVLFAPVATTTVQYCVNEIATPLSAAATTGNTLNWYTVPTGGVATTVPTPSTLSEGTFTYYVAQSGIQGIEGPRTTIVVTVNANPSAPVVTPSGATSFCTGSTITLTSDQATGNVWSDGSASTTASIVVGTTGYYTVTYTDGNGCSATSVALSVNVSATPIPTITASGPLSFCEGDSVILVSTSGDTYLWSDASASINDSLIVYGAGSFTVTTTNADACLGVGTSNATVIAVNPVPTAGATYTTSGNVTTFTNTGSVGASSYSWDFGDGSNSSLPAPVHAFAANATYTVVLTAIQGSCTSTYTFDVIINVGINELGLFENISLYPNPVKDEANLVIELNDNSAIEVVVYDLSGKVVSSVFSGQVNAGKTEFKIDTNEFENGIYYTKISTANSLKTIKMVVSK